MFFFFKQKTAYEMRISDWSSDVCSSDLLALILPRAALAAAAGGDTVPQVTLATPGSSGTGDGTITRFTLRFSEDMVALGDPRAKAPATHDCKLPATGRWEIGRAHV